MISTWMLHTTAVGVLLTLSAFALERTLLASGRPTRWVWAGSLAGSLLLPALWLLLPDLPTADVAAIDVGVAEVLSTAPAGDGVEMLIHVEQALALGWLLASGATLAWLALSFLSTRNERRKWDPAVIQGERVLVSAVRGPAVTGFLRPVIVLPRWAFSCSEDEQRLLLAHEREHLRAGDPRLLGAALLVLTLAPWNLSLWWQLRRLRLAVELDCDARVLRAIPRPREYGLLLLQVGRRASGLPLPATSFGEPRSFLERRVRRLAHPWRPHPGVRLALSLTAAAGIIAACELPKPVRPDLASIRPPASASAPEAGWRPDPTPYTVKPELANRQEFGKFLQAGYPRLLRDAGIGGTTVLWVRIDQTGAVTDVRISRGSGHAELDAAAESAMRMARFTPARDGASPVAVWIQLPVAFDAR